MPNVVNLDNAATADSRLPFDIRKQLAVLGHLISNNKFFEQSKHRIKPDWFSDPLAGKVYQIYVKFSETYRRPATVEELRYSKDISIMDPKDANACRGVIQKALEEVSHFGLDAIRTELTHWLHARIYSSSTYDSLQLFNRGEFEEAYRIVSDRIKEIQFSSFEEDTAVSFTNCQDFLAQSEQDYKDALPTGFKLLDDALVPGETSENGGLFRGDTTVILAPSNVGKTTCLLTTAVHNVKRGKNVLVMTHEGRPSDIREKILQSFLEVTKPELFAMYKTEEGMQRLLTAEAFLTRFLTYVPYNKAGMVVEDVVPIIRRRNEERIARNGRGYDLLVSDYPAKLSTERAKSGNMAKRTIDEIVYENYVQLALELQMHTLVAIQTNRQGSVANRDDSRLLTMEDVAESWGVMTAATNVITLNRDVEAAMHNRLTFYVAKSRSSETGRAIVARTDYSRCVSHSDKLGGTWYRGSDSMSDRIDDLLVKYNGEAIPDQPGR